MQVRDDLAIRESSISSVDYGRAARLDGEGGNAELATAFRTIVHYAN